MKTLLLIGGILLLLLGVVLVIAAVVVFLIGRNKRGKMAGAQPGPMPHQPARPAAPPQQQPVAPAPAAAQAARPAPPPSPPVPQAARPASPPPPPVPQAARPASPPPPPVPQAARPAPPPPPMPPAAPAAAHVPDSDATMVASKPGWGALHGISGKVAGQTFPIPIDGFFVGRDRTLSQVLIEEPSVSKRHVWVGVREGIVMAIDQSSTNGTYLNVVGTRVGEVKLTPGDTLIVGDDVARLIYKA